MTSPEGTLSYTYDAAGNLQSMSSNHTNGGAVTIIYDGDGNRVSKTVNGVTSYYLVDDLNPIGYAQIVEELSPAGAVQRQYTYGLQRISEAQPINGVWTASFYGYDGVGNVRQLTNTAGVVTDEWEYDAFGNFFQTEGSTSNFYLYRGEAYDGDLGLYYLRERYMNPLTGRFLARDSANGVITGPATLHKYEYANGDPVNNIDPSGMAAFAETGLLIGTIDLGPPKTQKLYDKFTGQWVVTSAPRTILSIMNVGCDVKALFAQAAYTAQGILSLADFVGCAAFPIRTNQDECKSYTCKPCKIGNCKYIETNNPPRLPGLSPGYCEGKNEHGQRAKLVSLWYCVQGSPADCVANGKKFEDWCFDSKFTAIGPDQPVQDMYTGQEYYYVECCDYH